MSQGSVISPAHRIKFGMLVARFRLIHWLESLAFVALPMAWRCLPFGPSSVITYVASNCDDVLQQPLANTVHSLTWEAWQSLEDVWQQPKEIMQHIMYAKAAGCRTCYMATGATSSVDSKTSLTDSAPWHHDAATSAWNRLTSDAM